MNRKIGKEDSSEDEEGWEQMQIRKAITGSKVGIVGDSFKMNFKFIFNRLDIRSPRGH